MCWWILFVARWAKDWRFSSEYAHGITGWLGSGGGLDAGPCRRAYRHNIFIGTGADQAGIRRNDGFLFSVCQYHQTRAIRWFGQIDVRTLVIGLWLAPLVPIGTWLGTRLFHVIPELAFRRIILAVTLLTGLQLVLGISFAPHGRSAGQAMALPVAWCPAVH